MCSYVVIKHTSSNRGSTAIRLEDVTLKTVFNLNGYYFVEKRHNKSILDLVSPKEYKERKQALIGKSNFFFER